MTDCRLKSKDWYVTDVPFSTAKEVVKLCHYSGGGSNTRTYCHGLYRKDCNDVFGIAWWIPPTKSAALAAYPANWKGVLALSRLVILPGTPSNACSFLIAKSRKLIDRSKWPCLLTYADTWRGHTGAIYKADNWQYTGMTKPERTYVLDGRMISRKAGPKTRTHKEMLELGAQLVGSFPKHRYVHIV